MPGASIEENVRKKRPLEKCNWFAGSVISFPSFLSQGYFHFLLFDIYSFPLLRYAGEKESNEKGKKEEGKKMKNKAEREKRVRTERNIET